MELQNFTTIKWVCYLWTVPNTNLNKYFYVTQAAGAASLTVSPLTDWSVAASGGTRALSVSGSGWSSYSLSVPWWITVTHPAANQTTLTAQANSSSARSGSIVIQTDTGLSKSFNVTQAAGATTTGTVTVTYSGNGHTGGSVPSTQTLTTPCSFQFRDATMTKANYTFVGWKSTAGAIYQVGTTYSYSTATSGSLSLTAEWKAVATTDYGSLNFAYPLASTYTGAFPTYAGHEGLDISAPKNAAIYSVDSGLVVYAGHYVDCGWYISVKNDKTDPTKTGSNNMITRYLHINLPGNMYVSAGSRVDRSQNIGLVGSRGFVAGSSRYNHLHIDANSSGNESGTPGSAYISPKLFWPNMFHTVNMLMWPGSPSDWGESGTRSAFSANPNEDCIIPSDQEIVESGEYFDLELVRIVGFDEFETWLRNNPDGTVYKLIEDYQISNEQLQSKLEGNIYKSLAEFSPVEYKVQFSDSKTLPIEIKTDISETEVSSD